VQGVRDILTGGCPSSEVYIVASPLSSRATETASRPLFFFRIRVHYSAAQHFEIWIWRVFHRRFQTCHLFKCTCEAHTSCGVVLELDFSAESLRPHLIVRQLLGSRSEMILARSMISAKMIVHCVLTIDAI
jgi:hypothetical protein